MPYSAYITSIKDALTVAFKTMNLEDTMNFTVEINQDGSLDIDGDPYLVSCIRDDCEEAFETFERGDCFVSDVFDLDHDDDIFKDVEATVVVHKGNVTVHASLRTTVEELTEYLVSAGMPEPNEIDEMPVAKRARM